MMNHHSTLTGSHTLPVINNYHQFAAPMTKVLEIMLTVNLGLLQLSNDVKLPVHSGNSIV